MADSIINSDSPETADVVLLLANYDGTSSFGKGAGLGPAAIVNCLHSQIEFLDPLSATEPANQLSIALQDPGDLNALTPEAMVDKLTSEYGRCSAAFRIMLGGEHSVTNAPLKVFADSAAEITIVQIDAHADLRLDDSDYNDKPFGKYAHCAVMRRAYELGYPLCQIGVRAFSKEESRLFSDPRVTVFRWGRDEVPVEKIVSSIKTKKIYITIDADGIDPAHMPATGTPVQGGLSWYYVLDLLRELIRRFELIGADLVEVAPRSGDQRTEYGAAQLVYSLIGCYASSLTR